MGGLFLRRRDRAYCGGSCKSRQCPSASITECEALASLRLSDLDGMLPPVSPGVSRPGWRQTSRWGIAGIGARAAGLLDLGQDPASLVLTREDLRGGNRELKGLASVVLLAHLAIGHPEVILHLRVIG